MALWWGPKLALFYLFLLLWIIRTLQFRFLAKLYEDMVSKFLSCTGFQYNEGFRHIFVQDFDLRELPVKDKTCVEYPKQHVPTIRPVTAIPVVPASPEVLVDVSVETESTKYPKDHHTKVAKMVSYSIDEFLKRNKKIPYNITRSYGNEMAHRMNYYLLEYQEDILQDNACFKMVNVDHFAEMEFWLKLMKPIVMYTFVPEGVGGQLSTGSFSCNDDVWSIVRIDGSGNAHMAWDYGYDYCTIDTCWGVLICPIEQFRIPDEPHYRVVCIIPATWVPAPFSMLVERRKLARLKVSYGPTNLLRFVDLTGRELLSMATAGSIVDYVMPSDLFDILYMRHKMSVMSLKAIEQFLNKEGVPKDYINSTFIFEIFSSNLYPPPKELRMSRVPMCEDAKYRMEKNLPPREPRYVMQTVSVNSKITDMIPIRRSLIKSIRFNDNRETKNNKGSRDVSIIDDDNTAIGQVIIKM